MLAGERSRDREPDARASALGRHPGLEDPFGQRRVEPGSSIENPDVDYASLAKSMGYWSAGPIKDPAQLGPTLKRAVEVVKSGQPALVDVWTQPR